MVDDHGLEAIRKATYQREPSNNVDYFIGTRNVGAESLFSSIEIASTAVTTTATQINTPDNCKNFYLIHKTHGSTLYVDGADVTSSSYPLEEYEEMNFKSMQKDNGNEIYGIASTGTITVWAIGVY